MAKGNFPLFAFNRGEVSRFALGRIDQDKLRLAAEEIINWMPTFLGPMTLRPGLQYLGGIKDNLKPVFIPFVFSNDDVAALELTNGKLRVWVPSDQSDAANDPAGAGTPATAAAAAENGELEVLTRTQIPTTVQNGNFSAAAGWHLTATDGCSATISGSKLTLNATARGGLSSVYQDRPIGTAARRKEHAITINVQRGPIKFRVGSRRGMDNYIAMTDLEEGVHSLAFTPTGSNINIYFETNAPADRIVTDINFEQAGILELDTPWATGNLPVVRPAQSGDIVYVACEGVPPYKIERRGKRSWSIVKYQPKNGPLHKVASAEMNLTPGAMFGNTTLDSERPFFKDGHVGCVFRLFSNGQTNRCILGADNTFTDPVRITGVGKGQRAFSVHVENAGAPWEGLITLQQSMEDGQLGIGYVDIKTEKTINHSGYFDYDDTNGEDPEINNTIAWYRAGFKDGKYRHGAAAVEFKDYQYHAATLPPDLGNGGGAGYCRVTSVTSSTRAVIEILKPFTSLTPTKDWLEGRWSDVSGYPSSVGFHDGRLWWAGGDAVWGTVSDDYENFDIDKEGDAGPILRTIGFGPVDTINWMLPLTRLILGREGSETSIRSSTLDEPITPTSFTLKDCSTKGSARVGAIKCDSRGIFVSKSGKKAYELSMDGQGADYSAHDLTRLHPDIAGNGGFKRLALQGQPDTTIHFIRNDGQVAALLFDKEDEIEAWWRVKTDGVIEEAFVLPGVEEDQVYYVVRRTINGATRRYLEKFARRDQCAGLPEARLADCHVIDRTGKATIKTLTHLVREQVVVWGWNNGATSGVDLGTYTVNIHGQIVLDDAYDNVCVGLGYDATFLSAKLAYAGEKGTAVNQKKRLDHLGLILYDTHYQGLQYGQSASVLDDLPLVSQGEVVDASVENASSLSSRNPFADVDSFVFDTQTGKNFPEGGRVIIKALDDPTIRIIGRVDSYSGDTLRVDKISTTATQNHTYSRWAIYLDVLNVRSEFDEQMIEVPGEWNTDSRLYLKASAPRPCTVAGAIVGVQTNG